MFRNLALFLLSIALCGTAVAQNDFGVWLGGEVNYPFSKKMDFGLELQTRLKSNATEIDNSFLSPSVKYSLHKHIDVSAAYRMMNSPNGSGSDGGKITHRLGLDIKFQKLYDFIQEDARLQVSARIRVTHEITGVDLNKDYLRGQLELSYNLPKTKLKPSLSAEWFYHFNDQLVYTLSEVDARNRFNKCRLTAELKYPLSKRHELKLFYFVEPQFESPKREFILGLNYVYNIKRKNK